MACKLTTRSVLFLWLGAICDVMMQTLEDCDELEALGLPLSEPGCDNDLLRVLGEGMNYNLQKEMQCVLQKLISTDTLESIRFTLPGVSLPGVLIALDPSTKTSDEGKS